MSATPIQHAIDTLQHIAMYNGDDVSVQASTARLKLDEHGIDLWCGKHLGTHRLGLRAIERLIYGLVGDRADSYTEAEPRCGDEPGWKVAAEWCPLDDLGWMLDVETYAEFIDGCVEARRSNDPVARLPLWSLLPPAGWCPGLEHRCIRLVGHDGDCTRTVNLVHVSRLRSSE